MDNSYFSDETMYYYSDSEPQSNSDYDPDLNYWRYDGSGNIAVWGKNRAQVK